MGKVVDGVGLVQDALTGLNDDIQKTLTGIDGLAKAAENARNQAILTQLTSGADLRRFHGQASRFKAAEAWRSS